jgi:hypothetical protein
VRTGYYREKGKKKTGGVMAEPFKRTKKTRRHEGKQKDGLRFYESLARRNLHAHPNDAIQGVPFFRIFFFVSS